ncbi:hypothetical protein EMIHUDRAFT_457010 [Emiliania huxleyi CCMP1516]|uniref:UVR domain-containing protein n=3 Tax=Emiliania huxleyi TaxID=2903 RepID=A0A0D3JX89_EMIH1|nr:hypothetical protein EMIHUDRAFT_457010 [Emiliania huxleyi CCMP1516]EOD28124.1 hypothetical protein EMIHUDRAFT_457010 [Emiliania huxleyi CCMP1516]|eukprot:XP_005780553.1 hypothetical protein EMIHUDRAFT_457010 [Emiliania huxleyi CCMP1516]
MEAEAELLSRQLGTLQDQRVRLERDKRLAASSQKFAEAGKVAAELKSLAARFEADKEAQERLLGQAEAARSAQAHDGRREAELHAELRTEQRELDATRYRLLREHEAAMQAALPAAEGAQASLLREQLSSSQAARGELRATWGWDEEGRAAAGAVGASDDDEEEENSDGAGKSGAGSGYASASAAVSPPAISAVLSALAPSAGTSQAVLAALADSDDSDEEEAGGAGGRCGVAPAKAAAAGGEAVANGNGNGNGVGAVAAAPAVCPPGSSTDEPSEGSEDTRAALEARLSEMEDQMQAAVDADDFEEASRIQDELDALNDAIDALG